jgi:hypothetical protein
MTEIIDCAKQMIGNHFSSYNGSIFGMSRIAFEGSYHDAKNVANMKGGRLESCLKNRLLESSNSSVQGQHYNSRLGLWCSTLEPRGESTELILSPLISLVKQALYMRSADESLMLNDDNLILENPQAFNAWIRTVFDALHPVANDPPAIADTAVDDDNEEEDDDDDYNWELPSTTTVGTPVIFMDIYFSFQSLAI